MSQHGHSLTGHYLTFLGWILHPKHVMGHLYVASTALPVLNNSASKDRMSRLSVGFLARNWPVYSC